MAKHPRRRRRQAHEVRLLTSWTGRAFSAAEILGVWRGSSLQQEGESLDMEEGPSLCCSQLSRTELPSSGMTNISAC